MVIRQEDEGGGGRARVLVAHADEDVRDALAAALHEVAGRRVVAAADSVLAIAALWLSDRPVGARVDEHLLHYARLHTGERYIYLPNSKLARAAKWIDFEALGG